MSIPKPFKNQVQSTKFFKRNPIAYDASDPGTGKTRASIDAIQGIALVLAPKSLLRSAWENDIRKFAPKLKTSVAYATNRAAAFAAQADVYITNTDAVLWLAAQKPKFFARFTTLIIDEASAFKHHTSKRSKALRKIAKYFERRYLLCGTPNSNSILDLWHQYMILDGGARLGKSFYMFRNTTCDAEQTGPTRQMVQWKEKPGAAEAAASLVSDITIRHRLEDCQDIPANHQYSTPFYMPTALQKAYLQMKAASLAQLSSGLITAVNAAAVATKLLQICSGAVYDEQGTAHVIDTSRYELIADMIEARQHSVVFFQWTHQRDALLAEFKKRNLSSMVIDGSVRDNQRADNVTMFQAGYYRVALLHPQSAAHGLTLTRATTTLWAGPTHNFEHFKQGNHRIFRAGQKLKTETITLIAEGTVEEYVYKRLTEKGVRQFGMLELLQALQ